jgi:hypothetical protein
MAENNNNLNLADDMAGDDIFTLMWLHHDDELDDGASKVAVRKIGENNYARNMSRMLADVSAVVGTMPELQPPQSLRNSILAATTRNAPVIKRGLLQRMGLSLIPSYRSALAGTAAAALLVAGGFALVHEAGSRAVVNPPASAHASGNVPLVVTSHAAIAMVTPRTAEALSQPIYQTATTHSVSGDHGSLITGETRLPAPRVRLHIHLPSTKQLPRMNEPVVALGAAYVNVSAPVGEATQVESAGYTRLENLNQPMLSNADDKTNVSSPKPSPELIVSHTPLVTTPVLTATDGTGKSQTIRWRPAGGEGDSVANGTQPGGVVLVNLPAHSARAIYAPVVLDTLRHGEAGLPISFSHF